MRHKKKGRKLNRTASHRKALMRNMALALISHKRIQTTDAKAKELRAYFERLVTYAKKGDLHGRRLILSKLPGRSGKSATDVLIHEIAPACKDRNGGYTRIIKLNNRKNDNAPVSLIELVDFAGASSTKVDTTEEKTENSE